MNEYRTEQQSLPRERLFARGPQSLSDTDLLAILLGSGTRDIPLVLLAPRVLALLDQKNGSVTAADLASIHGIGPAKACLIVAALEFTRRRIRPEGHRISRPEDILPLVYHLLDRKQESFVVVSLNGAHEVIATRIVTIGTLNSCQIHPREVFSEPITDRAAAIVAVHNHPSGRCDPSEHDRRVTEQLAAAGKILGIPLLDHIIVGKSGHYSFCDHHAL